MTKKNIVIALIIASLAAALLLTVRLRKSDRGEETVRIDPAIEQELAERDRAILRTDIAAAFPAWMKKWRMGGKDLDPATLQQDGLESLDPVFDIQEDEVRLPADDEELRALLSPDGTRYLEHTGGDETGEPDSELTIVDMEKKERRRLLFTGPETHIDDAVWADKETVIAVGSEEAEGGARQPLVWVFHLSRRLVSTYTSSGR
jgi:hypothetical protein